MLTGDQTSLVACFVFAILPKCTMQALAARKELHSQRLILRSPSEDHAVAASLFFEENRAFLEPWSPPMSDEFRSEAGQRWRFRAAADAFEAGTALKWLMFELTNEQSMIGYVHYSQINRGCYQGAMLGYAIGHRFEGQGLMTEALKSTLEEVFSERVRLHRVQANVIPTNSKSLAVLERLGFATEGHARNYLYIGGCWQDHTMFGMLNPNYHDGWLGL